MGKKGQISLIERFQLIHVKEMRETKSLLEHHSNNCCKQDVLMKLILVGKTLRNRIFA